MELKEVKKELNSKSIEMVDYLMYLLSIQENLDIINLKITNKKGA